MYNKFFSEGNPFWKVMTDVFDLFVLNIIWIVCSLPIVTFGPATTAANYALIQRARGEDTSITKDFFKSFKLNIKQGIVIGLLTLLTGAFLGVDIYLCKTSGTGIYSFFLFFFIVIAVVWAMTALYVFPILAKFDRKTKDIVIWAFTMMIKHLPTSLLMLVLIALGLYFCYRLPGLIFIMFGLLFQFCSVMFASMFKPYLPEPMHYGEDPETYDYNPKSGNEADGESVSEDFKISDDEAAMYGYDPEEAAELLRESSQDEDEKKE